MVILEPLGQMITIPTPWGPVVYEKKPKPAPPPPAPVLPPVPERPWYVEYLPMILLIGGGALLIYFLWMRK